MRRGAKAKKARVSRESRKNENSRVRDVAKRLAEALGQQTATSEILRMISRSPSDVQPVFDAIVGSAARLCGAADATLSVVEDREYRIGAHYGPILLRPVGTRFPIGPGTVMGRSILEARAFHVEDLSTAEDFPEGRALALELGQRTTLCVPLLREGATIGTIMLRRTEARRFSDKQIALLQTFADQAVIAIENVRLFKELEARNRDLTAALEQQTATSEVLNVISRSTFDLQPVLETVAENAVRLCAADRAFILRFDGRVLRMAVSYNASPELREFVERNPIYPGRHTVSARVALERRTIQVRDVQADPEYSYALQDVKPIRTILSVPMLKGDDLVGVIVIWRLEVEPFTDKQVALVETFADQAVIAIENVRLFTELQEKNHALTRAHTQVSEALEQQIATSEILRVISSTPTDAQPVFETIARNALRLCDGRFSAVFQSDGRLIHMVAKQNFSDAALEHAGRVYPTPLDGPGPLAAVVREARLNHIADVENDPRMTAEVLQIPRSLGVRSHVIVPMIRDGNAIGAIIVGRTAVGAFSDAQIDLLKTFADQAVIAIENVRLFTELQEKNRALTEAHAQVTEALNQQTATSDILRVISSSPTDVQPVFDAIVRSAVELCGAAFGLYHPFDGERVHFPAAYYKLPADSVEAWRGFYPARPHRGVLAARAILERAVVHIPDVEADPEFAGHAYSQAVGYRSTLCVPLIREGLPIGVLALARIQPGPFPDSHIALLQTFADQAVIAIQNVRLFTELRERTAQLGRSVDELTALGQVSQALSSMLDIEAVLTTIVLRAIELAGADGGSVYEYDEAAEEFRLRATQNFEEELVAASRAMRRGEGALGMVAERRTPIQIADISDPAAYQSRVRDVLLRTGYRAMLAVPLLRDDRLVGALVIGRKATGDFSPGVISLLTTFANQSALAIQNARLFREIADKSRQLEVASQHKSEFLANMSHELRTPLNAIIGFSEVLTERMFGALNEKQEEYLKDIHASGAHLLSLINDILDLSKIEAGRMELELTDFDLPTALDSALTLVRERAGRRGITLESTVDERLDEIRADERKIRQVVLNLLSNAIKFTPDGGRIEVRAVPMDEFVEVSVGDTGVGIAPEDQEAVFEEFRQVGTSAAKQEGTGLGLALCRKYIELHRGRIWVTSQVGVGSTFTFTIPVR